MTQTNNKSLLRLRTDVELPKLGRLPATLGLADGEIRGATKQVKLESVKADVEEKVACK